MKVGRWVYCKYCYKSVSPTLDYIERLVVCPVCNSGLAPLDDVIKAGSYTAWLASVARRFIEQVKEECEAAK